MFLGSDFLTQNALKYCISKREGLSLSSPMPPEVQKWYNLILFYNIVILGHIEYDLNFDETQLGFFWMNQAYDGPNCF